MLQQLTFDVCVAVDVNGHSLLLRDPDGFKRCFISISPATKKISETAVSKSKKVILPAYPGVLAVTHMGCTRSHMGSRWACWEGVSTYLGETGYGHKQAEKVTSMMTMMMVEDDYKVDDGMMTRMTATLVTI